MTTSHPHRLFIAAGALLVFFLAWALIAARPWAAPAKVATRDPRVAALQARELALRHEAVVVRQIVDARWKLYRQRLASRKREIASALAAAPAPVAAAPAVRVVTLPPLTVTRTS